MKPDGDEEGPILRSDDYSDNTQSGHVPGRIITPMGRPSTSPPASPVSGNVQHHTEPHGGFRCGISPALGCLYVGGLSLVGISFTKPGRRLWKSFKFD